MFFDLDDDERALQSGMRELASGRIGMARVRAAAETDGVDRALFAELAEAGVFALTVPESEGGLGLGATHAAVVFEELGRVLAPGPLVATHVAAGGVEGASEGTRVVGLVEREQRPAVVAHLGGLDDLLVLDDRGVHHVVAGDVEGERVQRPLDPITPIWRAEELPQGEQIGGAEIAASIRHRRDLVTAASLVGSATASLELAVAYAGEREQFGKAIGAFQAVKHLCADMLTRSEVARAAVHAAAVHLDDGDAARQSPGGVSRSLAGACLLAEEAAIKNAKSCIQVFGGMGFTWEVDAHLHLKRAVVWSAAMAGSDQHAEQVAQTL